MAEMHPPPDPQLPFEPPTSEPSPPVGTNPGPPAADVLEALLRPPASPVSPRRATRGFTADGIGSPRGAFHIHRRPTRIGYSTRVGRHPQGGASWGFESDASITALHVRQARSVRLSARFGGSFRTGASPPPRPWTIHGDSGESRAASIAASIAASTAAGQNANVANAANASDDSAERQWASLSGHEHKPDLALAGASPTRPGADDSFGVRVYEAILQPTDKSSGIGQSQYVPPETLSVVLPSVPTHNEAWTAWRKSNDGHYGASGEAHLFDAGMTTMTAPSTPHEPFPPPQPPQSPSAQHGSFMARPPPRPSATRQASSLALFDYFGATPTASPRYSNFSWTPHAWSADKTSGDERSHDGGGEEAIASVGGGGGGEQGLRPGTYTSRSGAGALIDVGVHTALWGSQSARPATTTGGSAMYPSGVLYPKLMARRSDQLNTGGRSTLRPQCTVSISRPDTAASVASSVVAPAAPPSTPKAPIALNTDAATQRAYTPRTAAVGGSATSQRAVNSQRETHQEWRSVGYHGSPQPPDASPRVEPPSSSLRVRPEAALGSSYNSGVLRTGKLTFSTHAWAHELIGEPRVGGAAAADSATDSSHANDGVILSTYPLPSSGNYSYPPPGASSRSASGHRCEDRSAHKQREEPISQRGQSILQGSSLTPSQLTGEQIPAPRAGQAAAAVAKSAKALLKQKKKLEGVSEEGSGSSAGQPPMEYDKDGRLRPADASVVSSRPSTPRVTMHEPHPEPPRVLPSGKMEPTAIREPALVGSMVSSSQRRPAGVSAAALRRLGPTFAHALVYGPGSRPRTPLTKAKLSDWATRPTSGSTAREKSISYAQPNLGWGHVV